MSKLRETKKLEIKNAIKNSCYFTLDDFEIDFSPEHSHLVVIKFIAYPYFTFIITEDEIKDNIKNHFSLLKGEYKTKNVIQTRETPGDFKEYETKNYDTIDSCIYRIDKWIKNLYDDLKNINTKSNKNDNSSTKIKEELDKKFNDIEKFNTKEIEKLKNLLNNMDKRVKELENRDEISANEANKLADIVKISIDNLAFMPKKTWFLTTYNRLKNINNNIKTLIGFKDTIFDLIGCANKLLG